MKQTLSQQLRIKLLEWYDRYGRELPWRAKTPDSPNPYHVWLSEMMLQQTTVATVLPYFRAFLEKWPTLKDLSRASQDEILVAWQGLGYYARAHNLHKCAQTIVQDKRGIFPCEREELIKLPGIGTYMSAAIASIAFNKSVVPVDGNVIRVLTRLDAIKKPLPGGKGHINALANTLAHPFRPGDFAQALMDLGAMICLQKAPRCSLCPWQQECKAFQEGDPEKYPLRAPKNAKPIRYGIAFILINAKKKILIRKRQEGGLLAGLYGVPTTQWRLSHDQVTQEAAKALAEVPDSIYKGQVKHTFTHFHLKMDVYVLRSQSLQKKRGGIWVKLEELNQFALSTLMKKVITMGGTDLTY
jgi:A/G-specific adenine glycosylase